MQDILDDIDFNKTTRKMEFASFGQRAGAAIIDTLIIIISYYAIFLILEILLDDEVSSSVNTDRGLMFSTSFGNNFSLGIITYFIFLLLIILYYSIMESCKTKGTLGKMALGIIVARKNGDRISFGRALARYFSRTIWFFVALLTAMILHPALASIVGLITMLVIFIRPLWDDVCQGLHDRICGTYVFKK